MKSLDQMPFAEFFVAKCREADEILKAERIAREMIKLLGGRAILVETDVASCRNREEAIWHDDENPKSESWDLIEIETSGESSMSDEEARELLRSLRLKAKRTERHKD